MSNSPVHIDKARALPPSMDANLLLQEAVRFAQQVSGAIWTDYNPHDPGVTILEYLCYAITDLGYRANFSIEDILYAKPEPGAPDPDNALYEAASIFPSAPLTVEDYRKLIIDNEYVSNAWIVPLPYGEYDGLYRIKLQLNGEENHLRDHDRVIAEIRKLFLAHRNLCEDIDSIIVLDHLPFSFSAEITLQPDALVEAVVADIFEAIESYLIPPVRYASREAMQKEGRSIDEIFDGPKLTHGLLPDSELRQLPKVIYTSEVRDIILSIKGVRDVRDLVVAIEDVPYYSDEIEVPADTYLSLSTRMLRASDPLRVFRNQLPVTVNYNQVSQIFKSLTARNFSKFNLEVDFSEPVPTSGKTLGSISAYFSFQRFLPAIYGVGPEGLPRDADQRRRAQARQLKGYLLLVEHFLSSFLAQLTHVRSLFSIAEADIDQPSYFGQFPHDVADVLQLLRSATRNGANEHSIDGTIAGILARFDRPGERRNRFLDHLLARFGERFETAIFSFLDTEDELGTDDRTLRQARAKARFLRNYPVLSRDRGQGFDYSQPAWEAGDNISGLKRRLYHYLDIAATDNRSLAPANLFAGFTLQRGGAAETGEPTPPRLSLRQLLAKGQQQENYSIAPFAKQDFRLYFVATDDAEPQLISRGKEPAAAERVRDTLLEALQKLEQHSRGFFEVEHILLRPYRALGRKVRIEIPVSRDFTYVFKSIDYEAAADVEHTSHVFLFTATNPANYEVFELCEGKRNFRVIVLTEEGRPVLMSEPIEEPEEMGDYLTDREHIARIISVLNTKKKFGSASIDNWISFDSEPNYGQQVGADFFSHRISLIIPNWTRLFQNLDFRQLFEKMVAANIPVHLAARIHWVGIDKLRDFEKKFRAWLRQKEKRDNPRRLDECSLDLIKLLATPAEIERLEDGEKGEGLRPVYTLLRQEWFDRGKFHYLFPNTDFQIFEGIGPKLHRELRDNGVRNWSELAGSEAAKLEAILQRVGMPMHRHRIPSWQEQAQLADERCWEDLLALQREIGKSTPKLLKRVRDSYGLNIGE